MYDNNKYNIFDNVFENKKILNCVRNIKTLWKLYQIQSFPFNALDAPLWPLEGPLRLPLQQNILNSFNSGIPVEL